MTKKKLRFTTPTPTVQAEGEDRISDLPDELIHHILWFLDVQTAVQTCILSKRWKPVWTTLPFINFTRYDQLHGEYIRGSTFNSFRCLFLDSFTAEMNLFDKFFSHRNHDSRIFKLYLSFFFVPPSNLVHKFINYAISRQVQDLNVHIPEFVTDLSTFNSASVEKLTLSLDFCKVFKFSDCWDLPALTTLRLILPSLSPGGISIPELYVICLPSLQTLFLDRIELPDSLDLPDLVTLYLARCKLPSEIGDFSALSTLTLDDVEFQENETNLFPALVNLRNLTWFFRQGLIKADCVINCPQLVNLNIYAYAYVTAFNNHSGKFMLVAPKIRNISCVGLFPITFGLSQLESVNMKIRDRTDGRKTIPGSKLMNIYYRGFTYMFQSLGSTKILTLDLETIEVLSSISDSLVNSPPPFYNLKYVKVPKGCKESSLSTDLKCYLLGRSPEATIVTELPQKNIVPHSEAASVTARNAVLHKPMKSPINMLVGPENLNKTVCIDTLDMGMQEKMAQNSVVSAEWVTQIEAPVEGTDSESISSSRKNSDFGLWQGSKLQDLQNLRAAKVQQIQNACGTKGKNLVVGYIGDDLFSDP
ncbi:hypothetical protein ACET3Z_001886 [Daucus carota]